MYFGVFLHFKLANIIENNWIEIINLKLTILNGLMVLFVLNFKQWFCNDFSQKLLCLQYFWHNNLIYFRQQHKWWAQEESSCPVRGVDSATKRAHWSNNLIRWRRMWSETSKGRQWNGALPSNVGTGLSLASHPLTIYCRWPWGREYTNCRWQRLSGQMAQTTAFPPSSWPYIRTRQSTLGRFTFFLNCQFALTLSK